MSEDNPITEDFLAGQFKRFILAIGEVPPPQDGGYEPRHVIEATGNAIQRFEELHEENERLRDRIAELERVISPDPEATDYESLTRDEKVFQLRAKLVRNARNGNGRDRMLYGDVQRFFDKHPSPGHTYDLMELAGNASGFDYNEDTGEKRITVNLEGVNDDALIRAANKTPPEQPA